MKLQSIITGGVLILTTPCSKADKQILIEMSDATAQPVIVEVAKISKIKFNTSTFNLEFINEVTTNEYIYAHVKRIAFKEDDMSSLNQIDIATPLKVSPNPVQNNLHLLGGNNLYGANVNIYSTTGTHVMSISQWNGEDINVSHLSPGLYVINIKSTTIKFIKL